MRRSSTLSFLLSALFCLVNQPTPRAKPKPVPLENSDLCEKMGIMLFHRSLF